jgi:hypothetical protein
MAADSIAHFVAQRFHGIGLGEDGLAKGPGNETAFIGFFDEEYDFFHGWPPEVGMSIASIPTASTARSNDSGDAKPAQEDRLTEKSASDTAELSESRL